MKRLLEKLKIDETYILPIKKQIFDKVKQNTYSMKNYNYMADLQHFPTTKKGFKYTLVMVDLWSNMFDIEPLKTKEPAEVLKAMQTIFKRPYLKSPHASIKTDGGTEFKGIVDKYMFEYSILHRTAEPYRHQQMENVESLNRQLARLFNGYMNRFEEETGKQYNEWTDIIAYMRKDLNDIRKKPDGSLDTPMTPITEKKPKYKVGDLVVRKLERPKNALGHHQTTTNFRMGDYRFDVKNPRKITKVLYYPNNIRYVLNQLPNVSYTEAELKTASANAEKYTVKQIIGKKGIGKNRKYLIWWRGYLKKDATWEPEKTLRDDGLGDLIDEYNQNVV